MPAADEPRMAGKSVDCVGWADDCIGRAVDCVDSAVTVVMTGGGVDETSAETGVSAGGVITGGTGAQAV